MRVFDGPVTDWPTTPERNAVTIGVFDGVHRGHRALIRQLDDSLSTTVLTFDPHPIEVLSPGSPPRLITTIDERMMLLDEAGVDNVGVLDLAEIKEMQPEYFVEDVLVDRLETAQLAVGDDFRFGKDRAGDVDLLRRLGKANDFRLDPVGLIEDDDGPISSSRIRSLIERGAVGEASDLLGSRFIVTNQVIAGDKRGRELGFPTANLKPPNRKLVPGIGVYGCFVTLGEDRHQAAVNVGVRPTFGGGQLLIEAYILDFDAEIYGESLTVEFVSYLRPELKFEGIDALVSQMGKDVSEARAILDIAQHRI